MLNAGSLNKRIELQSKTSTADGLGGYSDVWATAKDEHKVWAAIWDVQSNERVQATQRSTITTHQIRIRYNPDIRATWRIKWDDKGAYKYFSINGIINPNMANEYLDILCKEVS